MKVKMLRMRWVEKEDEGEEKARDWLMLFHSGVRVHPNSRKSTVWREV